MVVLPFREQMILLITFVIIFIVFWIDEKGKKDDNVVDADFEEVKDENKEKSA